MAYRAAPDDWDSLSRNPQQVHVPTAPYNPNSQPQSTKNPSNNPSNPQPPRKAKHYRRRHAPVGPAGVWFQTQQSSLPRTSSKKRDRADNYDEEDEEIVLNSPRNTPSNNSIAFYSPAWMSMQCELGFVTPSLPAYLSEQERYTLLRPHIPNNHLMIPEILQGKADWKLPDNNNLFVLVDTIQALSDNLWTVELTDETGYKMSAWIQPKLVSQEEQRSTPHYIRPGLVWMLQNVTILLVAKQVPDEGAERVSKMDRILMVSESNIQKLWTPSHAEQAVSDQDYIHWMERRNTLTSQVMEYRREHGIGETKDGMDEAGPEASDEEEEEEDGENDVAPSHPPPRRPSPQHAIQSPPPFTASRDQTLSQASSTVSRVQQFSQSSPASFSRVYNASSLAALSQTSSSAGRVQEKRDSTTANTTALDTHSTSSLPQNNDREPALARPPGKPDTDVQESSRPIFAQRDQPRKQPSSLPNCSSFAKGFNPPEKNRTSLTESAQPTNRASSRAQTPPPASTPKTSPAPSGRTTSDAVIARRHTPDPVAQSQSKRTDGPIKHDFQRFAAAAADFMSQQSPMSTQNTTSHTPKSTASSQPSPKPSQQKENAKPKRQSSSSKSSTAKKKRKKPAASPKTPSKLWAMNDSAMLEMFGDESDDDMAAVAKPINAPSKRSDSDVPTVIVNEQATAAENAKPPSALFQASAFEGVDMDDLFDDDDGDD